MRATVIAIAAAGCGRIGFAELGDGSGIPADTGSATVYVVSKDPTLDTNLMTLDLATGELRHVFNFTGFGILGGLAYWDANTLYLSGNGEVVEVTMAPASAAQLQPYSGNMASLERNGSQLVGIEDAGNVVLFAPGNTPQKFALRDPASQPIPVDGGDLTQMPNGDWLWWANSQHQLYRLDLAGGVATPVGAANPAVPYVSGMVHDDAGHLFITTGITDELIELDPMTAAIVASRPLCMPCPTPYNLDSGDMTRSP